MDNLHRWILVRHEGRRSSHPGCRERAGRVARHPPQLPPTNNATEYEALLLGLRKAKGLGARRITVKSDSRLMAGHFDKSFIARDPEMARYLTAVRTAAKHFLGAPSKPSQEVTTRQQTGSQSWPALTNALRPRYSTRYSAPLWPHPKHKGLHRCPYLPRHSGLQSMRVRGE